MYHKRPERRIIESRRYHSDEALHNRPPSRRTARTPQLQLHRQEEKMDSEILTWLLIAACAAGFGGGAAWQAMRRRAPARTRRNVDKVAARPVKASPAPKAPAPAPEVRKPQHGVHRPSMLALTTLENSVTAADLFIRRALELDEPYYRELPAEAEQLKALKGLFARCRTLDIVPGDGLSKDVFSLNFSTMIVEQLRSGFMPHPNATSNDLQIIALANGCEPLGDPMAVEDFGVGGFPHVTQLWMMVDPTDKKHELDDLLEYELNGIRNLLPRVKLLVPALDAMKWGDYWDKLFDLVRDVRRLGAGEGQALMRTERTDVLAKDMYAINRRIDESLATLEKNMKTPEEADVALTSSIPHMLERELSVLFLRTLAVIRVISGDNYIHGMHCSAHIRRNVEHFPDVHSLLDKARHIVYDALEVQGRGMNAPAMDIAGQVKRDADELGRAHDESVERLKADVERLQAAIDRYLILQGRPRRYAVRLNERNEVSALLVLEH